MSGTTKILELARLAVARAKWVGWTLHGGHRGKIFGGAIFTVTVLVFVVFIGLRFLPNAGAQSSRNDLPTAQNPIVVRISDPDGQPTNIEPLIIVANGQLHVSIPEPKSSFRPGKYKLALWIWQNGTIYYTENDFTWGVLAVNFNKSIYHVGDTAEIGFAVLDDAGRTLCNAEIEMAISSPSGKIFNFRTRNATNINTNSRENIGGNSLPIGGTSWVERNSTCGPATVTNDPDYSAVLNANEVGTYAISVVATTANGVRQIADIFWVI